MSMIIWYLREAGRPQVRVRVKMAIQLRLGLRLSGGTGPPQIGKVLLPESDMKERAVVVEELENNQLDHL